MKNLFLLCTAAVAGLSVAWPQPAPAYIDFLPPTLGDLCRQATHVHVVKVDKVNAERGVILFKSVAQLKGKDAVPLPDDTFGKQVIGPDVLGAKVILDSAAEGKTAVVFAKENGFKSVARVYLDGCWYLIAWNRDGNCWFACNGEPTMLIRYCGTADRLNEAVKSILKGEEVVVPAMASDDRKALLERRGKVLEVRASLKILGNFKENIDAELLAGFADDKKPGAKPGVVKPGTPEKPGAKPEPTDPKPGEKKPDVVKPGDKPQTLAGTIKAIAADGKSFTLLLPPTEKDKEGTAAEVQIGEKTKVTDGKEVVKLVVGQTVTVTLDKGDSKVASVVQLGKPGGKPVVKPAPGEKPGKPGLDEKPDAPKKPRPPAGPVRDPKPTATAIDAEIDRTLAARKIPASPRADDAEFLRRVTLDLTGRIPTYQQTVAFLDSKDPDKRRKLIDELLDRPEYGEHLATVWGNRLVGRGAPAGEKGVVVNNGFRPWLAEQLNDNRGWNAIVTDLLTAEGTPNDNPATGFLMANGEQGRVQPNKVVGSVSALFWGVNLRCAECHNHPFANWKQQDFWGTAAFFGRLQYGGGGKSGPPALTESATAVGGGGKEKGAPAGPVFRGAAVLIPGTSGKAAGQLVRARFLGGEEPNLDEQEPFRPRFAGWATSAENPYFAKAAVNRVWAHFFGRGFVNPLDGFDETNPASHPELLDRLAKEFTASGFDMKHLARCITTSGAYQRTSRPVPGNETDAVAFSHMAVKVLTPEVLYDALGVVGKEGASANAGKTNGGKVGERLEPREAFLRSFRVDDDVPATEYLQGIPQLLRMMNASSPNRGAAVVENLSRSGASRTEAITTLYLTVLSRRPTAEEVEVMSGYLSRRKDEREGYRGVLWILLNTSEFAVNH